MQVIEVAEFGGPEVLRLRQQPDPVFGKTLLIADEAAL